MSFVRMVDPLALKVSQEQYRASRVGPHYSRFMLYLRTPEFKKFQSFIMVYVGFPIGSDGKESTCNAGPWVQFLSQEDLLEKGMDTHSSILAWGIPWTEKPGELQSMMLQRVRCDWVTEHSTVRACMYVNVCWMCLIHVVFLQSSIFSTNHSNIQAT